MTKDAYEDGPPRNEGKAGVAPDTDIPLLPGGVSPRVPAPRNGVELGKKGHEELVEDPLLDELSETQPAFLASIVAKWPLLSALFFLVLMLGLSVPAFLDGIRPEMNNAFESLLLKDHEAAELDFAAATVGSYEDFFQKRDNQARRLRRRLLSAGADTEGPGGDVWTTLGGGIAAQGGIEGLLRSGFGALGGLGGLGGGRALLQDVSPVPTPPTQAASRECNNPSRLLNLFYRWSDNSTVVTDQMVAKAKAVEDEIYALDSYKKICITQSDLTCHHVLGFPSLIYAERTGGDGETYTLADTAQQPVEETAVALVGSNFTFFFNIESNGTYSWYMHSVAAFCEDHDRGAYENEMIDDLFDIFDDVMSDSEASDNPHLIVNFGESLIVRKQVDRQILMDAAKAIVSLLFAAIMLRIGSGSTVLTIAGLLQLLLSFPIAWVFYAAPKDWHYINFLHFLAPFIIIGIGLDDIFVFVSFYRSTLRLAQHFAIDTRLTQVFNACAAATLATSTTSAFAFAANIFSPVPAIQSFGLLIAMLVIVNYVLAITWLPVCLTLWDRYIMLPSFERALVNGGEGPPICGCIPRGWLCCLCEEDSAESRTSRVRGSYTAALNAAASDVQLPRVLEYDRIAWPFHAAPPHHRLARSPSKRPPVVLPPPAVPPPMDGSSPGTWWANLRAFFGGNFFGRVFDWVYWARWPLIVTFLAISIAGAIGTAMLDPPPTSEPPLFEPDHNVQFFWRYQNSEEADNIPSCTVCKFDLRTTLEDPAALAEDPAAFFEDPDGAARGVLEQSEGLSKVTAELYWGVAKETIDSSIIIQGDPISPNDLLNLTFSPAFDISQRETQALVRAELANAFAVPNASMHRRNATAPIALGIRVNPLDELGKFCNGTDTPEIGTGADTGADADRRGCNNLDEFGLPEGEDFQLAAFNWLAAYNTEMRAFMGYSRITPNVFDVFGAVQDGRQSPPRVAWLRVDVTTTTVKAASPDDVAASYWEWRDWAEDVQLDQAVNYTGMFPASTDWVAAITYSEISSSVFATVFISIALSGGVVFVFTGRVLVTLLATLCVTCVSVTVMGVLYLAGWTLGAIEGMSITSLVGLAVDFMIHVAEGHMHARAATRRGKAREALSTIGMPMVASAVSTVVATSPLFFTQTLILSRFAVVIAITMAAGVIFTFCFMTPAIAMIGPDRSPPRRVEGVSLGRRTLHLLVTSKAIRFIVACLLLVLLLRVIPKTRRSIEEGGIVGDLVNVLLVTLAAAAVIVAVRLAVKLYLERKIRRSGPLKAAPTDSLIAPLPRVVRHQRPPTLGTPLPALPPEM